jgi:hypothetical protein
MMSVMERISDSSQTSSDLLCRKLIGILMGTKAEY